MTVQTHSPPNTNHSAPTSTPNSPNPGRSADSVAPTLTLSAAAPTSSPASGSNTDEPSITTPVNETDSSAADPSADSDPDSRKPAGGATSPSAMTGATTGMIGGNTTDQNHHHHHHSNDLSASSPNPSAASSPAPTLNSLQGKLAAIDIRTLSCMVLNFASSTAIVVMNKIAMDKYGFKFATTLTSFHLFCTFFLLLLAAKLGIYEIKKLPIRDVSKLAAGTMGFICFTNLSLQHNSIGFYQVMKVMTTPTVVIFESLFYQKYLENNLKVSLIPVCLGVIITVATDFRLNLIGTGYAIAGVIVTSLYQIWSGTLQRSLDCNGLQLQTYVSPLAAAFVIPFIPLLDNYSPSDPQSIWYYKFDHHNTPIIAITGFFGFLVNISIFLVIGRSSPLSYNILGHCKTVVVLLSDYILFDRPATFKSSFGILLTLIGVFWYTSLKLERARIEKEARERTPKSKDVLDKDRGTEENVRLMQSRKE